MVSNLALLLGAGMTVSKAWNRLTENYMNERQKRTICRKEVYEEMQRTSFEIKNGMGEERAYERFGERCGGYRYRKFGNLLAQNLRKGSRGLTRLLEQEAEDAFEERKSMARKLGGGSWDKDVVSDDSDARCGDVNTGISSYAFHGIII